MADEHKGEVGRDPISRQVLYEECGRSYRYHIDWRYRILTRYLIAVTAVTAVSGWMYTQTTDDLKPFLWAPFVLNFLLSLMFFCMSLRSGEILNQHHRAAERLEEVAGSEGVYTACAGLDSWPPTFNRLFLVVYAAIGLVSFVLAILLAVTPITD